jgi:hypothetical protein
MLGIKLKNIEISQDEYVMSKETLNSLEGRKA